MLRFRIISSLFFVSIGVCAFLFFQGFDVFWVVLILAGIWVLTVICGSFFMQWKFFIPSLISNKNIKEPWVAITFDDGPHPEFTPIVLSLLKKHNAKATFFCIGKQVEKYPEIVKKILKDGHTLGNHTYTHSYRFGFFSKKQVIKELQQTDAVIEKIANHRPKLYRPVIGVTNPQIAKAIKTTQHEVIGWNKRSLDTTFFSKEVVYKRVTRGLSKGDVILLHDTNDKTVAVLERLLLFLQKNNLESVTVNQLFAIKAYA